ncbi:KaiC [uncultured archaeon]|nr:KaiC [uncultured archaeon]
MFIGIKSIDDAGGLPEASNVLLLCHPGADKSAFSLAMLCDVLQHDRKAVFITTDIDPREIERKSSSVAANMDLARFTGKSLWFVDCYTWTLGTDHGKSTEASDIVVPGPSALNDLSIGIAQSLQNATDGPTAVFQSVSTLLLYNNPEMVFRFVQITGARLKASNATTLFVADAAMHDEKTVATLRHLTDLTIELKSEGGKQMVLAPALGILSWTAV